MPHGIQQRDLVERGRAVQADLQSPPVINGVNVCSGGGHSSIPSSICEAMARCLDGCELNQETSQKAEDCRLSDLLELL